MKRTHGDEVGVPVAVSFQVTKVDSPDEFLPRDSNGTVIPLEIVAIRDFYDSRTDGATPGDQSSGSSEVVDLPSLQPRYESLDKWEEALRVDANGPADHYLATATYLEHFIVEFRFVLRPAQRYAFIASYVHCPPPYPTSRRRSNCYQIQTVPMDADPPRDVFIKSHVQQGMEDLVAGRRGMHKPHIGDLRPLLKETKDIIANGVASLIHDFETDRLTLTIDGSRASKLDPPDLASLAALYTNLGTRIPRLRGQRSSYLPVQIRHAYAVALRGSTHLLEILSGRTWPPCKDVPDALATISRCFKGDPRQMREVATLLTTIKKRPTPHEFAVRVVARLTGQTPTNIRNVLRKK